MNTPWTAIGWTMLHYLWVGAAVLALAAVLRTALRRAPARARYAASLLTLASLTIAPILCGALLVDWNVGWVKVAPATADLSTGGEGVEDVEGVEKVEGSQVSKGFVEAIGTSPSPPLDPFDSSTPSPPPFDPLDFSTPSQLLGGSALAGARLTHPTRALHVAAHYAPYVWLVGAPLTLLVLASGVIGAERLKHAGSVIADPAIQSLFDRARQTMRVSRRVALLACDRVAQPVLIGVVRPAILLPPALLAGLSTDELELVLLHELAHVRRWDNLVNLLQRLVEALLFFHPAVWIASRWARRDREECCDALVVGACGRRQQYAGLLVRVAQSVLEARSALGPASVECAMAQPPLARRVRRILNLEDDAMLVSRRLLLMVVLAVVGTLGVAAHWAMAEEAAEPEQDVVAEEPVAEEPVAEEPAAEEPAESDNPFGAFGEGADESSDPFGADGHESNPFGGEMEGTDPFGGGGEFGGRGGGLGRPMGGEFGGRGGGEFGGEMGGARGGGFGGGEFSSGPQAEQPSGAARKKAFQFPTAEEQRYADRAFHLLAIEVEKVSPEEVERVEKLGLQGGVRIASTAGPNNATRASWLREGDILVGLKTSPITGLKDLFDFLGRDDLGESQPMKMYVVRRTQKPSDDSFDAGGGEFGGRGAGFGGNGPGEFGGRGGGTAFTDEVVSGRISPDMNAWTATQKPPSVPQGEKVEIDAKGRIKVSGFKKPATPPESPTTLYDGKTFDEWRSLWRNELKPERRTEAVRAMAAFARAGRAEEACEAILDVAAEYDFSSYTPETPTGALLEQIANVLRRGDTFAGGIPAELAWPKVLDRYRIDPEKYTHLLVAVMRLIKTSPTFRDDLLELSKSDNPYVREQAMTRLARTYGDDPEISVLLVTELRSGDAARVNVARNVLRSRRFGWVPEADGLLTELDPEVQLAARQLAESIRGEQGKELAERVLQRLAKSEKTEEQIACIRAIASLRKHAPGDALEMVRKLAEDKDDRLAIAAVVAEQAIARPQIHPSRRNFDVPDEWAESRGVEVIKVNNGRRSRTPEWQALDEAVKDEAFATFGIE